MPGKPAPADATDALGPTEQKGSAAGAMEPIDPAQLSDQLTRAAQALGRPLSTPEVDSLAGYLELLRRWNDTYNLTAVRDPRAMVTQHLVDCLAATAALERSGSLGPGGRVLDAGSGGGLPGVVLAILHPDWQVTCVDAVAKKVAFVRQVAGALGLGNLSPVHARLGPWRTEAFDLVTSRAFSSLADLVRYTEPLLTSAGCWMAMKGQVPYDEIAALPGDIETFHVEPLSVPGLEAQRCLVWMRRRSDSRAA